MMRRYFSNCASRVELQELKSKLMDRNELLSHLKSIEERLECIQESANGNGREVQRLKKMMAHVTAGLGLKFERFNKAWLEHFLQQRGIATGLKGLEQGRREFRLGPFDQVELDLFSLAPPLVVECTSFLDADELGKVERFARIHELLSERYRVDLQGYVVALAVHRSIASGVQQLCDSHGLTLITQFD